nr:LOW QUALITY PROTEIN: transmembrane protease serine 9-like [Drosophila suzukii]
MLKLLFGLALIHQLDGSSSTTRRLGKIFGGYTVPVRDHSFLVNLRRGGKFRCGGVLISPSCVLTAAHCLEGRHRHVRDLTIHAQQQCLGDATPPEHVRPAWYVGLSPHYCSQRGLDADVAVIRLSRPFDIAGNASLVRIDFNDLPWKANLTVMGWGSVNEQGHNWNQCLQEAKVELIPQEQCIKSMDSGQQRVTNNMFCALGENAKDACQGDSGGPIIHAGRSVGIVSWGYGCGSGYPGVYTRLSSPSITYWLKSFMDQNCCFRAASLSLSKLYSNIHSSYQSGHAMAGLWLLWWLCQLTFGSSSQTRIVGGKETTISQVPYLVNLRQNGYFICGGSLISTSVVLSAAHCVYGSQPEDYTIHAGASRLDEGAPVVRNIAMFHTSPSYSATNFDMDVALLQLQEPVLLIPGKVATITPCRNAPEANAYARISGWGVTRENNRDPAEQVRTAMVRVLPGAECQLSYSVFAQLSDSMLCAAVRGVRDSCSGDSGGPLVYRGQVCGIVSWGFGCARPAFPGVYTNVASGRVYAFIEQTLQRIRNLLLPDRANIVGWSEPMATLWLWLLLHLFPLCWAAGNEANSRIVGGVPVDIGNVPYLVNLRIAGRFICGGSLVTPQHVVTAAHCVKGVVRTTLDHDVALLQLQHPLQASVARPISLAVNSPRPGSFVRVSGWGLTDDSSTSLPNQLHSVHVRVMPQWECRDLYRGYRNITASMFCASIPGLKDACAADSGGPVVNAHGFLVGVVSWGRANRCAAANSPGVYSDVSYLSDWIIDNMRRYC